MRSTGYVRKAANSGVNFDGEVRVTNFLEKATFLTTACHAFLVVFDFIPPPLCCVRATPLPFRKWYSAGYPIECSH